MAVGGKSSSEASGSQQEQECTCYDSSDTVTDVYIITAKDMKDFKKLEKRLTKDPDCKDNIEIISKMQDLMCILTVRMHADCAEEVSEWGYSVESNSWQYTNAVDEYGWMRDRIDQVDLPLLRDPFGLEKDGADTTIFLLDTGVRTDHVQFGGRASFYKDMVTPNAPVTDDPSGHGTMCAGAAIGESLGVAKGAQLLSIRVADSRGSGTVSQSIQGLNEVYQWTQAHPAEKCVVSYSISSAAISGTLEEAVTRLLDNTNCVVVVSAGNNGLSGGALPDACSYSPGRLPRVITVGASRLKRTGTEDHRAGFSNYGECVDIYAPGHKVQLASSSGTETVTINSGTSFAAPAVAGAVAVLLSNGVARDDIEATLISSALQGQLQSASLPAGAVTPSHNRLLNVQGAAFQ